MLLLLLLLLFFFFPGLQIGKQKREKDFGYVPRREPKKDDDEVDENRKAKPDVDLAGVDCKTLEEAMELAEHLWKKKEERQRTQEEIIQLEQKQYEQNERARQGRPDPPKERSFKEWLRIRAKRLNRKLKWTRQQQRRSLKHWKRKWAKKLVTAAGRGGTIVTPKLNFHSFKGMTRRVRRVLQLIGHCGFVDNELTHACRRAGVLLVITNERYTTKNCPACFEDNNSVGASKIFICPTCRYEGPRDGKAGLSLFQRFGVMLHRCG